jgi:hypothetical protein
MKIARIILAALLFCLVASALHAQTITTVTGTVLDPDGTPFAGGIVTVTLNGVAGQPSPIVTATGSPIVLPTVPTANSTGVFSTNLVANASITPASTTYNFRVCAPPVPPPLGSGNTCVTLSAVTIAGASQDLTANFAAVPPPPLTAVNGIGLQRVGTISQTAQAANIAAGVATTLLTVPANVNGTYRLACYVVLTQAATTSSTLPACNVVYTDADTSTVETIAMTTSPTTNTVGTLGAIAVTALPSFQAKAGTTIQYSTSGYASVGGTVMQYAVRVKAEFLGAP